MTNKEALSAVLLPEVSEGLISKALTDYSIDGDGIYNDEMIKPIDLCAAEIYARLITSVDYSEGDLSVKHSRKSFLAERRRLLRKYGLSETDSQDYSEQW